MDILALKDILSGQGLNDAQHYGMSKREYNEFIEFFGPSGNQCAAQAKTDS